MKNGISDVKKLSRLETHYLLTNIKGVMIYLLVVFHIVSPTFNATQFAFGDKLDLFGSVIINFIAFIMVSAIPMFVAITGFGAKDTDACRETAFGLYFVPYAVLSLILSAEYAIFTGSLYINIFQPMMQLWFLLAMYIWMLIAKDVSSIRFAIPITIAISLICGMVANGSLFKFTTGLNSFFALSYVVVFLPFFVIGMKTSQDTLSMIRNSKRLPLVCGAVALTIPVAMACFIYFNSNYRIFNLAVLKGNESYLTYFSTLNSFTEVNLSGVAFRSIFIIFAIALCVLAIRFMPKKKVPLLTKMGNSSMTIFCLHIFIIVPITSLVKIDILPMFLIALPLAAAICLLLSVNKVNKTFMGIIFRLAEAVKIKPKKAEG